MREMGKDDSLLTVPTEPSDLLNQNCPVNSRQKWHEVAKIRERRKRFEWISQFYVDENSELETASGPVNHPS
jgi:hypothetical protein